MPLLRLSYIYWLIHFNFYLTGPKKHKLLLIKLRYHALKNFARFLIENCLNYFLLFVSLIYVKISFIAIISVFSGYIYITQLYHHGCYWTPWAADLHPKLKIRKIIFFQDFLKYISITLREKCQNTEFFLVPIPSERRYLLQLMEKVEMVITRMRWKAVHFNSNEKTDNNIEDNTEWYGLKSPCSPRQVKELIPFENDSVELIRNIKFRKIRNTFQE